jgi:hypothetical protein
LLFARYELIGFRLNTLGLISARTGVNPSRDVYKTKADLVNLTQQAVADGVNLIQQQRDIGLDKTTKVPFGNKVIHNSYCWTFVVEDRGEDSDEYQGHLVVLPRANNMVPRKRDRDEFLKVFDWDS